MAFMRSPQTIFVGDVRPETEVFWGDLAKAAVAIVCFGRFN